jgi:N-acetylglucosaminyldiphosphoundecaprenol N-acetyl-beta-D-mannosaminyltransferase
MEHLEAPFMEYRLFLGTLDELPEKEPLVINTLNQYSYCIAEKDGAFKKALLDSDVLLPDGIGVVAAVYLLNRKKIKKIAGADLFKQQMDKLEKELGSCFFLGSHHSTLDIIKEKLLREYPSVRAGFYSPPFKPTFSKEDNENMIHAVNAFQPDVLFIGMTAPKQEKWANEHKHLLKAKTICSIGAVFDFYAGTVERPADIWIKMGLEWFVRLLNEPKRMWRRYLYYGPVFAYSVIQKKLSKP